MFLPHLKFEKWINNSKWFFFGRGVAKLESYTVLAWARPLWYHVFPGNCRERVFCYSCFSIPVNNFPSYLCSFPSMLIFLPIYLFFLSIYLSHIYRMEKDIWRTQAFLTSNNIMIQNLSLTGLLLLVLLWFLLLLIWLGFLLLLLLRRLRLYR